MKFQKFSRFSYSICLRLPPPPHIEIRRAKMEKIFATLQMMRRGHIHVQIRVSILHRQGSRGGSKEAAWPRTRCRDSVSPSARLIQASITKTLTIHELPFGECLETSSAPRLNQTQHQPRPYALSLSEQTKPFQCPSLHAHSPNCNRPRTLGSTVLLGKCTMWQAV